MADRGSCRASSPVAEADEGAEGLHRFDQYAKACYDFFWRDFLRIGTLRRQAALRDPARAGQTRTCSRPSSTRACG
jgi:hypothetical protein